MREEFELAKLKNQRVFYETTTKTIRLCPEDWVIAYRDNGKWHVFGIDAGATDLMPKRQEIKRVIEEWQGGSTGGGIAEALAREINW